MLAQFYDAALVVYPVLGIAIFIAALVGWLVNTNGSRRVAVVILSVHLLLGMMSNLPGWGEGRLVWLTVINMLAAIPLLIRPVLRVQKVIAALFLTSGVMHCLFAISATSPLRLTVNWFMSVGIDAAMAAILIGWSGGHLGKAIVDRLRHRGDHPSSAGHRR